MITLTKKNVLVLCALPYTNAIPHVGNIVGSHLPADIFARFSRLKGNNTIFIGGTDENGTPTEVASIELGVDPKTLTETFYKIHKKIYDWLEISYDNFSRTSLPIHHKTSQEFFTKIHKKGYISEGTLKLPYCEHDKMFLPDRYVEGKCPNCGYENARGDQCDKCTKLLDPVQLINPKCKICGSKPVIKETEHLFLELGKLQSKVEKWIRSNKHWREQVTSLALSWIKDGLKKRCITRDLRWGIKVPLKGYENKIFYVWFEAPIGYVSSTKEWAEKIGKPKEWEKFWKSDNTKIYNFLGKDNIPFHTIFWPAMIIANGELNLPHDVVGLQYLNYEGGKISKSRKWGVFCEHLDKSGIEPDVWRYYFSWLIPETKDTEFKWKEFQDRVNNELVGNIGNFVHRTLTFIWNNFGGELKKQTLGKEETKLLNKIYKLVDEVDKDLSEVKIREALSKILEISAEGNKYFQNNEPWKMLKENKKKCEKVLFVCANICKTLGILLNPYLPVASENILNYLHVKSESLPDAKKTIIGNIKIDDPKILFEKIDDKKLEQVKNIVTNVTDAKSYFNIPTKSNSMEIEFTDFQKLDMRIGKVLSAEPIEGSDKLLKMQIDFGTEKRQCIAGISKHYTPENLVDHKFVFVVNLKSKKLMGLESECMLLATENATTGDVVILKPEKDVEHGSKVR